MNYKTFYYAQNYCLLKKKVNFTVRLFYQREQNKILNLTILHSSSKKTI